ALARLGADGGAYNMPAAIRLDGALDERSLAAALVDLVARHLPLRTVIAEGADGAPRGRLLPVPDPDELLQREDVTEDASGERIAQEGQRPFDLGADLLLRARLFRLGATSRILALTIHHAAGDGVSQAILARELGEAYGARLRGRAAAWQPLAVSYADLSAWQHD